jgi:UDP-N-acetyl-2-amino-2-deoxyglucuronate dehydrogenase
MEFKKRGLNYAIIGSGGFIAPRHVEAIHDTGGKVLLTCDIDPTKKADFTDYREMLASERMKDVDAVVICTPNYLHPEMVRDSLKAGKRVLCEKPLSINTDFSFMDGVNIVLQLRYHDLYDDICRALKKAKRVDVVLKAYRDEHFWKCWKGDELMSGGVVYIMGAHMFDLILCALKGPYWLENVQDNMKKSSGIIHFGDLEVHFDMEFLDNREGQSRHLLIDGEKFVLSTKDNLSFEGLHDRVYRAFIENKAPDINDVKPSIALIDAIKKHRI